MIQSVTLVSCCEIWIYRVADMTLALQTLMKSDAYISTILGIHSSCRILRFQKTPPLPPPKKTQQNTPIYLSIAGKEMMQFLFAFART